jgi:hypothetical protein
VLLLQHLVQVKLFRKLLSLVLLNQQLSINLGLQHQQCCILLFDLLFIFFKFFLSNLDLLLEVVGQLLQIVMFDFFSGQSTRLDLELWNQKLLLSLLIYDLRVFVSLDLLLPFFIIKLFLSLDCQFLLLVVGLQIFLLIIEPIDLFFQEPELLIHSF